MSSRNNLATTVGGLRPHDNKFDDPSNRFSGTDAVGLGFLTGDIDDEEDDEELYTKPSSHPPGLTPQGRPGPAVVTANLNITPSRPAAAKVHPSQGFMPQPRPGPAPIQARAPNQVNVSTRAPPPAVLNLPQLRAPPTPGPMTPHPLQPPKTPIAPAFARPRLKTEPSDVKFTADAILRGNKEETLLARNTPKGAEFWRRFSVVVKEEQRHPGRFFKSNWLTEHQSRSFRMNLCIWVVGLLMLAGIAGGGVLIWFLTSHNSVTTPKVLGGNAGEGNSNGTTSGVASLTASSTSLGVYTVKGDLPPTTTPTIPAGLTLPTTPPVAAADPNIPQKRDLEYPSARGLQKHRRHMRRLAN